MPNPASTRLNSWKDIANYLERDPSTVMRWEKERDLPVHRVPGGKRQAVFAYTYEIDHWLSGNGNGASSEEVEISLAGKNGTATNALGTEAGVPAVFTVKPRMGRLLLLRRAAPVLLAVGAVIGGLAFWRARTTAFLSQPSQVLVIQAFRNMRPDPESDFLGAALADVAKGQLSYTSQVVLHPPTPIYSYEGSDLDLAGAQGEQRQVLVTGSYVKEGEDVSLFLDVVAEPGHVTLWHGSLQTSMNSLMSLQDLIGEQIGSALHVQVRRIADQASANAQDPPNPGAYQYFLRGVRAWERSDLRDAIQWHEKAVSANPDFGPALAYLPFDYSSYCYQQSSRLLPPTEEETRYLDKSVALYRQAIDRNAASPAILSLGGLYFMELGRLDESVVLLRRAVQLNPNYAQGHLWLSQAYRYGGMLQESRSEAELAFELDPDIREYTTANTYLYLGEYDKFLDGLPRRQVGARILFYRGLAHYYSGDRSAAEQDFRKAYEMHPEHPHAQYSRAFSLALASEKEEGLRQLRLFERNYQADGEMLYKTAQAYAILGDRHSAVRLLRQTIEHNFYCHPYFRRDPILESVRDDPEYSGVMELARARNEAFRRKFF